jgi:hypothetical protein
VWDFGELAKLIDGRFSKNYIFETQEMQLVYKYKNDVHRFIDESELSWRGLI